MKNPKCIQIIGKSEQWGNKELNEKKPKQKTTKNKKKKKGNVNKHYCRKKKYHLLYHQLQINHILWGLTSHVFCTQCYLLRCDGESWGRIKKTLCLISLPLKCTEKHVIFCKCLENIQLGALHFIKWLHWFPWEVATKRENRGQYQMLIL